MSKKDHVWEFGHGEVVVGIDKKECTITLRRVAPDRKFAVGESVKKDDVSAEDESRAPVVLKFTSIESLNIMQQAVENMYNAVFASTGESELRDPSPTFIGDAKRST